MPAANLGQQTDDSWVYLLVLCSLGFVKADNEDFTFVTYGIRSNLFRAAGNNHATKTAASLPPQPGTTASFKWICYNQFSLMWCHESMNPQNLQCLVISITRHFQSIGHKDALHAGTSGSITYMCPEPLLENVWYIAPCFVSETLLFQVI